MKRRTIAEKTFIADNRPNVRIEKVEFSPYYATKENSPVPGRTFSTAAARDAMESGAEIACLDVTFYCVDAGAVYDQKFVRFGGPCRILDYDEFDADGVPPETIEAEAGVDGKFTVTVSVLLCKSDDIAPDYFKTFCMNQALYFFNDVTFGNQFVTENFGSVMGIVTPYGDAASEREHIIYDLAEEEPDADDIEADVPNARNDEYWGGIDDDLF